MVRKGAASPAAGWNEVGRGRKESRRGMNEFEGVEKSCTRGTAFVPVGSVRLFKGVEPLRRGSESLAWGVLNFVGRGSGGLSEGFELWKWARKVLQNPFEFSANDCRSTISIERAMRLGSTKDTKNRGFPITSSRGPIRLVRRFHPT
jgi:hypothetical protein